MKNSLPMLYGFRGASTAAMLAGVLAANAVLAQQLEEVMVTAQKRTESMQDVPIAIATVTGDSLETFNVVNLEQLRGSIPNVQINHFGNAPNTAVFSIRGIGVIEPDPYAGNTVSIVMDGVPQYFNQVALLDLFDIQRVEVLKGPQGTLFGANSTGGVINIATEQPTGEFGGKARLTLGNWNRIDSSIAADFPIIENVLAGKVTFMQHSRDGWIRNIVDGKDMGSRNVTAGRGYLKWTPTDDFDATLIAEVVRGRDGSPVIANGAVPTDRLYIPNLGYERPCSDQQSACEAPDKYRSANDSTPDMNDLDSYSGTLTMNWFNTAIGDVVSISNYKQYALENYTDQDASADWIMDVYRDTEGWQLSQELRTTFNPSDRLEMMIGGFFMQTNYEQFQSVRLQGVVPGLTQTYPQEQDNWSASVFMQNYLDLTDSLVLQFGLRYSVEETEMDASTYNYVSPDGIAQWFPDFNPQGAVEAEGDDTWENLGGKIGLDWAVNEDLMLYGYYARGFKSGGFVGRIGIPEDIGPFDPETVDTFEVGMKGDFLDGLLRANLALFYNDYKDMQLAQIYNVDRPDGIRIQGNSIVNAAGSTISGLELDLTAIPTDQLTLRASFAYLDAEYDDFEPIDPATQLRVDMSGQPLQNSPEWTASASARYDIPVASGLATAVLEYSYTDEKYLTNLFNRPRSLVQETHLVNASLQWAPDSDEWSVSVWARNLLDERYITSGFETTGFQGFVSYAPPREAGVSFNYRW
ncbi:TonB-dependent receptor [Haliea sp. E17]|uniref:TonB-dependent receptor n=1 Tax=Haliea sp. E17 TaxID=3401576 RepID=UPI003AAB1D8D